MEILNLLEQKMLVVLVEYETKLNRSLPIPKLELGHLGRCAGRANFARNIIEINVDFCNNGNFDYIRDVTLPHEVAHIVTEFIHFKDYRSKGINVSNPPHGPLWKQMMRLIGLPPNRCHSLSVSNVKTRTVVRPYVYKCNCNVHYLTELKHKRFQSGHYTMCRCRICKQTLVFVGVKKVLTSGE